MADYVQQFLASTSIRRISKQAFSSARQKISHLAFLELLEFSYRYLHRFCANRTLWYGHIVKAVDGTTIRVPNTAENRQEFQTQKNQHGEVALAKASVLFNISDDLVEHAVFGTCRDSEKNQALKMLTMESVRDETPYAYNNPQQPPMIALTGTDVSTPLRAAPQQGPIILFDRGYPSGELISHMDSLGGLFLMRCHSSSFKHVCSCPQGISDTHIFYKKKKIGIRVIRFFLDNGTDEILITNLFDDRIGLKGFQCLHAMRWGIEGKYRELKQQLKMENFTGIKPLAVKQELYATLVFSNIVSALKSFVDVEIEKDTQGKGNKWDYQSNRNFLIGEVKKQLHLLLGYSVEAEAALECLLYLSRQERSPIRPDRTWERIWHIYDKTATYRNNQRTAV